MAIVRPKSAYKYQVQSLVIHGGEWGTRFLPNGRHITREYVQKYKREWKEVASGTIFRFIKTKNGTFKTLDAQHRTIALSEIATELNISIEIKLVFIYEEEVFANKKAIADYIVEVNQQKAQSLSNLLEAYQYVPGFFADFVSKDPRISYQSSKKTILLSSLIESFVFFDNFKNNKALTHMNKFEYYLTFAETATVNTMQKISEFLNWWYPVCMKMGDIKINSFKTPTIMKAALLVYDRNHDNPELDRIIYKLTKYPAIDRIRSYVGANRYPEATAFLIEVMNFQRRINLLENPLLQGK